MKTLIEKVKKLASILVAEKPKLHFLALVHRVGAPEGWDVVIASDQLAPRAMDALDYVAERLKKVLSLNELIQISRIVVLPRNHEVIAELMQNYAGSGVLTHLFPASGFDRAVIIWPLETSSQKRKKVKTTGAA